jgi:hypothetical protein
MADDLAGELAADAAPECSFCSAIDWDGRPSRDRGGIM